MESLVQSSVSLSGPAQLRLCCACSPCHPNQLRLFGVVFFLVCAMNPIYILCAVTGSGALVALYFAIRLGRLPEEPPLPPRDIEADARDGLDWNPEDELPDPDAQSRPFDRPVSQERACTSRLLSRLIAKRAPARAPESDQQRASSRDRGPGWAKTGTRDIAIGLCLIVSCALPFVLPVGTLERMVASFILLCAGLLMLERGSARQHGLAVEKCALRKIKLPSGWEMETSVPISGKGDADLLITSPDDVRFVVEVKAQRDIVVNRGYLGGGAQILGRGGKKMPRDPLAQVVTLGGILQAFPVLWFPDGRGTPVTRIGNPEVIVVQGKERVLLKAIGARRGLF